MNISYLITIHNEDRTLEQLLRRLVDYIKEGDEIVIIDDFSDNPETQKILSKYTPMNNVRLFQHALANDYGSHKNYGNSLCRNEYICQIDGDECPTIELMENIHELIEVNSTIELFFVPRINDYIGVADVHARQWGWRLTPSASIIHEKVIDTDSSEYKFLKDNGYIIEEGVI